MRKNKHPDSEKQLCQYQEQVINQHLQSCHICQQSKKEYDSFGVSSTPPCKRFMEQLGKHIESCHTCNKANKNWNDDAFPTTQDMRDVVGSLSKGKLPDISKLKNVASHLIKELELSSDEVRQIQEKAEDSVRKGLKK